jgi:PhnB protein
MINPYLFYDGNCEEALAHYQKVLGAKVEMLMRSDEAPADMKPAPGREKKIMHARISIDGAVLMVSDAMPEHFHKPQGFAVSLTVADRAEAERKFHALCEGGSVNMPFGKTFFSQGFGMGIDRFGIPWMVNCP